MWGRRNKLGARGSWRNSCSLALLEDATGPGRAREVSHCSHGATEDQLMLRKIMTEELVTEPAEHEEIG